MLWKDRRESNNVVDERSFGVKTIGIGTLVVGAVIYGLLGGNPLEFLLQNAGQVRQQAQQQSTGSKAAPQTQNDDHKRFVAVVLADTEDVWNNLFKQNKMTYREPKLVLFSHSVESACGRASSSVGPFYCPRDQRVYLDLSFFKQLADRLGAQGDFAEAYVIAHEVGHHVQTLLGVSRETTSSVPMELQADCLAGVWAKQTQDAKQVIEAGDIDEAINAAAAVGDDRIQKATRGQVVPDSFTHGSSVQRVQAFKTGFAQGQTQDCLSTYK